MAKVLVNVNADKALAPPEHANTGTVMDPFGEVVDLTAAAPPAKRAVMEPFGKLVDRTAAAPPANAGPRPRCTACERPVDPTAVGVKSREKDSKIKKGCYRCASCNSATTMLSRACRGWPTDEFRKWDDESKVNFFANRKKGLSVTRQYAMTCAKIRWECSTKSTVSQMQPLRYWTKLGYDEGWLQANTQKCDQQKLGFRG